MTKFNKSEIVKLLPQNLVNNEVTALSYALSMAIQKLITYADQTRTTAFIDSLDEKTLDYLSIEYSIAFYSQEMKIEQKREAVKNILAWYAKSGTKWALEDALNKLFGKSKITEWFGSGDQTELPIAVPYLFLVEIESTSESAINQYLDVINKLKNVRSKVALISQKQEIRTKKYGAAAFAPTVQSSVTCELNIVFGGFFNDKINQFIDAGDLTTPLDDVIDGNI